MILYQKLYDIDKNGRQTISRSLKPVFRFKKNQREDFVKNGIKTLAQENLFILKKLLSKNSDYSTQKLEKQYKQSQKYKKNICHYPSIDFYSYSSKDKYAPIVQSYDFKNKKDKKEEESKLPKLGVTFKSNYSRAFRTTHGHQLDEIYYKEATKSSRLNSTTRSKFKNTRYNKKNPKEASNIEEESNEGSSSGKNESGDENSDNGSGSGDGSGSGEGSGDGEGSKDEGSKDGEGSGSGSGSGD